MKGFQRQLGFDTILQSPGLATPNCDFRNWRFISLLLLMHSITTVKGRHSQKLINCALEQLFSSFGDEAEVAAL